MYSVNNKFNLVLTVVAVLLALWLLSSFFIESAAPVKTGPDNVPKYGPDAISPSAIKAQTEFFDIRSTAPIEQTARMGKNLEILHQTYNEFFAGMTPRYRRAERYKIILYKNQDEFHANSPAPVWAEAYYKPPYSYAYFSDKGNCCHWMMHEAVHQLNREWMGLRLAPWINEGIASYFSSSQLNLNDISLGEIDRSTYPIWWLADLKLSGALQDDIASGQIIPLRVIISGEGGPEKDSEFNRYYIHYWSLSHFLLHYDNGKYAGAYRPLIKEGGSLGEFEKMLGPVDKIEREWYVYLQELQAQVSAPVN